VGTGDRSERIRTYNFPQGRVTDHRIGMTWHQLNQVLDGELHPVIEALAEHERAEKAPGNGGVKPVASPRTVMDYLQLATGHLDASGVESPRLDAEVLLADLLGIERIQLYVQHDRPLTRLEVDAYRQRIARRARREPVAYITGKREFYSLELKVDRRCLIPRPETEHLVETALAELGRRFRGPRRALTWRTSAPDRAPSPRAWPKASRAPA